MTVLTEHVVGNLSMHTEGTMLQKTCISHEHKVYKQQVMVNLCCTCILLLTMFPARCRSRFSQHSTFEVDRSHQPQLGRSSFSEAPAPDSARVSESGTAKAADGAEKSKRKGRFQIVEEDPTDPGKRGVGRSTSVASMDSHRSAQVSTHC